MAIQELAFRHHEVIPFPQNPSRNQVSAADVFNFHKNLILPNRDKGFSADFFNGNHLLDRLNEALPYFDNQDQAELKAFIERIVKFPQVQIPTVEKNEFTKTLLPLRDIMKLHDEEVNKVYENQLELADFEGDNARLESLYWINKSVRFTGIQVASQASISLPAKKYTPSVLIPLFNVATAIKLAHTAHLPLPQELSDLESTSYNADLFQDPTERYF